MYTYLLPVKAKIMKRTILTNLDPRLLLNTVAAVAAAAAA
jgi:hypothetical protein